MFITCNINITGKYVALTHGITKIGVSAKIIAKEERERLRSIVEQFRSDEYGFVIRTNSEGVDKERMEQEIKTLQSMYERIVNQAIHFTRFYKKRLW